LEPEDLALAHPGPRGHRDQVQPLRVPPLAGAEEGRKLGRAVVAVPIAGALPTVILGLGLHVNPPRVRRAGCTAATEAPAWEACVSPEAAALGRARGYVGAGSA